MKIGVAYLNVFKRYTTVPLHLKKCFPHLIIEDHTLADNVEWVNKFLKLICSPFWSL